LGQPFISLEPGGSETVIADGGEIQFTQGAIDIWKLVSEAMFSKSNSETTTPQPPAGKSEAPGAGESPQAPSTAESPQAPATADTPESPEPDAQPNVQQ
jgi:phospholipid/cholesterol/gamma-HCH transport system substrate-binding protein